LLSVIVAEGPVEERKILAIGNRLNPFRRMLNRRRIDLLLQMRFVENDGHSLKATLAGIGAIRPWPYEPSTNRSMPEAQTQGS
jgi:hypothetical protein